MRGSALSALLATAITWALLSGTARADIRRVVLVHPPPNLREAIEIALEPWSIEVMDVDAPLPGAAMPRNAAEARALGRDRSAGAVVWFSEQNGESALWIYDAKNDHVVARRLPHPPPFDEPTAAAVALSVKTLLRHSVVAPVRERFGAKAAIRAPPRRPRIQVASIAVARIRPVSGDLLEPRLGVGALWSPGVPAGFAVAMLFRGGPGVAIDESSFLGHLSDLSLGVAAQLETRRAAPLVMAAWLGPTLHVSRLDGAVLPENAEASVRRLNPSLDAGGSIGLALGAVRLELRVEGGLALRRQRYLVRSTQLLELPLGELEIGLGVTVPVL